MRSLIRLAAAAIGGIFMTAAAIAQTTPARVPITSLPNAAVPFAGGEQCLVVQSANVLLAPCGAVGPIFQGSTPPASPLPYALFWNTSVAPRTLSIYDGSQWVQFATLDATGHIYALSGVTLSGSIQLTGSINGGSLAGVSISCSANTCTSIPASALTGIIASANLPVATTSAIGAVKRIAPVANNWINSIDATGTPLLSQPTTANISGAGTAITKNTGTTVVDPGTGNLESVQPYQTVTGNSKTYGAADLGKETRRSNSTLAMTDTLPALGTTGLVNGVRVPIGNADTSAADTVSAGAGTSLAAGDTGIIDAGRSVVFIYDLPNTTWRRSANTGTAAVFGTVGSLTPGDVVTVNTANGKVSDGGVALSNLATGAASSATGNLPSFADTTGKVLADSGTAAASVVTGPGSSTTGNVPSFNGTSGKIVQDSGKLASALVTGPSSATSGNLPSYNGTTGKIVQDSGVAAANVVTGPASVVTGNIATFNGTTGKIIQDSGVTASNLVTGPGSSVSGNIPSFNGTSGRVFQDSGFTIASGTWTPNDASGASLVFTNLLGCTWTRFGNTVHVRAQFKYPSTASPSVAAIGGFPFANANAVAAFGVVQNSTATEFLAVSASSSSANIYTAADAFRTNTNLSLSTITLTVSYQI